MCFIFLFFNEKIFLFVFFSVVFTNFLLLFLFLLALFLHLSTASHRLPLTNFVISESVRIKEQPQHKINKLHFTFVKKKQFRLL